MPEEPTTTVEDSEEDLDRLYNEILGIEGDDPPEAGASTETEEDVAREQTVAADEGESPEQPAPDEAAPDEDEPDIFAGLTEEQQAYLEQREHELQQVRHAAQSDSGRISAYQRQIREMERRVQEAEARQSAPPPQVPETVQAFQQEFPETATAVSDLLNTRLQQIAEQQTAQQQRLQSRLDAIEEHERQVERQEQIQLLSDAHTDWADINQMDEYSAWLNTQSQGVQALAGSAQAADVVVALDLFKEHMGVFDAQPEEETEAPPPAVTSKRKLQERGVQQTARSGSSVSPEGPSGDDMDRLFDYYATKKDKALMSQRR